MVRNERFSDTRTSNLCPLNFFYIQSHVQVSLLLFVEAKSHRVRLNEQWNPPLRAIHTLLSLCIWREFRCFGQRFEWRLVFLRYHRLLWQELLTLLWERDNEEFVGIINAILLWTDKKEFCRCFFIANLCKLGSFSAYALHLSCLIRQWMRSLKMKVYSQYVVWNSQQKIVTTLRLSLSLEWRKVYDYGFRLFGGVPEWCSWMFDDDCNDKLETLMSIFDLLPSSWMQLTKISLTLTNYFHQNVTISRDSAQPYIAREFIIIQ